MKKTLITNTKNTLAIGKIKEKNKKEITITGLEKLSFRITKEPYTHHEQPFRHIKLSDQTKYSKQLYEEATDILLTLTETKEIQIYHAYKNGKQIKDYPLLIRSKNIGIVITPIV